MYGKGTSMTAFTRMTLGYTDIQELLTSYSTLGSNLFFISANDFNLTSLIFK